jgi:hypothetical protein
MDHEPPHFPGQKVGHVLRICTGRQREVEDGRQQHADHRDFPPKGETL